MDYVYTDYNATTPIDESVQKHIVESLKCNWGNPSSENQLGNSAKLAINEARREVATAICAEVQEIIFTSGGTESSNMAIQAALRKSLENSSMKKPHIITSNVEHVATLNPLKQLKEELDAKVTYVPVDKNGHLSASDVISAVTVDTCLITIMLANNETGVIFPISEIARKLKELNKRRERERLNRILFHSDAAQAVGKIAVDVNDLRIDYLTIAGHKFYGPKIGALYVRNLGKETSAPVQPVIYGGGQERGYRPGTENTPMIVGLGKAAALVQENIDLYKNQMEEIRNYFEKKLSENCNIVINCKTSPRLPNTSNVSFCALKCNGAQLLRTCKLTIASTTAACHTQSEEPSDVLLASGVPRNLATSAIRFSFGRETTLNDVNLIIDDIKIALAKLVLV